MAPLSSGPPPDGFHLSMAPLSAHFFTRLSHVLQFISELDCNKHGGAAPSSAPPLTAPSRISPVVRRLTLYASGVLCHRRHQRPVCFCSPFTCPPFVLARLLRWDGFKRKSAEASEQLRKNMLEALKLVLSPKGVAFY
jgi:hypothetical protein